MVRLLVLFVSAFQLTRGDRHFLEGGSTFNCKEANHEIDEVLANSNLEIKSHGDDNMLVDLYGFDTEVSLYAFGWKLPISVALSVSKGNLTGVDTLKRSTDAADCSTSIIRTLEGIFEYGPGLALKYDVAHAKFLRWGVHGKFMYKPRPRMRVALLNGSFDCRFESISSENPGPSEYVFETDNTWKGWFISKLLTTGIQQKDETSLESQVNLWCQGEIASYFAGAWCSHQKNNFSV